jgi:branched-chain amino acid transport system permease protein
MGITMKMIPRKLFIALTVLLVFALLPLFLRDNLYAIHILIMCFIWAILASAWDLTNGYAGVFNLAQIVFFVCGGYTSGMLAVYLGISPWVGILTGGITAALLGIVIALPCLRVKGVYAALVTLGLDLLTAPLIARSACFGTGGTEGLQDIPPLRLGEYVFSALDKIPWYFAALAISSLSLIAIYKIIHSPVGLAFVALRDGDRLAKSLGVNEYKYKLIAFGLAGFFAGIAGSFYVHYVGIVSPRIMALDVFLIALLMMELGGIGRFPGAAIGAFTIIPLAEFLRLTGMFRFVVLGAIIVLIIVIMPQGLMGIVDSLNRIVKGKLQKIRQKEVISDE